MGYKHHGQEYYFNGSELVKCSEEMEDLNCAQQWEWRLWKLDRPDHSAYMWEEHWWWWPKHCFKSETEFID